MNEESDYGSKLVSDLIQIVEDELDIYRWRFQLSHTKLEKSGSQAFYVRLIYDSEWCRVQLGYRVVLGIPDGPDLHTAYGRLHAPNDAWTMIWAGEKCRCWHSMAGFDLLRFLDGASPREAWELHRSPRVVDEFRESDLYTRLRYSKPAEGVARAGVAEENAIWNHYGVRLFELFDLRHPDLWEEYMQYLRELEEIRDESIRIKGNKPITFDPPRWRIC